MLKMRTAITKIYKASDGLIRRFNIAEKRINNLEDRSTKITKTENTQGKKKKKKSRGKKSVQLQQDGKFQIHCMRSALPWIPKSDKEITREENYKSFIDANILSRTLADQIQ